MSQASFPSDPPQDSLAGISTHAHWLLRLALASVFLYHGAGKLATANSFSLMMDLNLGLVFVVAGVEVAAAALLLAGGIGSSWMTRIGAASMLPVLIGAITEVHWGRWSFSPSDSHPLGGMEFQVVLLLLALWFVIRGNKS